LSSALFVEKQSPDAKQRCRRRATYSGDPPYLGAIAAAGTDEATACDAKMRERVRSNDFISRTGRLREDVLFVASTCIFAQVNTSLPT